MPSKLTPSKLIEFLKPPEDCVRRGNPVNNWDNIILTSRVRLARNLDRLPFPGRSKIAQRVEALKILAPAVAGLPPMKGGVCETMDNLIPIYKEILVERHLISREHKARGVGSAVALSGDEEISVMINEEDHLRMQAILPGLQVKEAWKRMDSFDSMLEKRVPYAYSSQYGYLTACPTNVGTGIRVSAMLHLPGLVLADHVNQTINAANRVGMTVRGLYGEGTEALGNVFQVSNQSTLGVSESEIVEKLKKTVLQIVEKEEDARQKLCETQEKKLRDYIGRAYGNLSYAHVISSKETKNHLSLLRLGVDLNLFPADYRALVDELLLVTEPAHIQKQAKSKKNSGERDSLRATILRRRLAAVKPPDDRKLGT